LLLLHTRITHNSFDRDVVDWCEKSRYYQSFFIRVCWFDINNGTSSSK